MVHTDQAILRTEKADVALSELQFGDAAPELEADGRGVSMKGLLLGHASALQPDAHENATTKLPPDLSEADAPAGGLEAIALKPQGIVLESESRPASSDFSAKLQDTMTQIPVLTQSIQQAAHAATRALEGKAADRLTPAVGSTGWDQALGQKVVWMVAGEQQSASLTLNPPDLGPLQVVLNVNNSQASATFTAAQPEVRQALEAALPKLRDMLNEAGIQLGQATVGSGSPNQQSQEGRSHTARHDSQGNSGNTDASGIATLQSGRTPLTSGSTGIVDTFV
jgi:flagellar hook-length control protein FliK